MEDLFELAKGAVPAAAPLTPSNHLQPLGFSVEKLWRRLIDLESDSRIQIQVEDQLSTREGVQIFRYAAVNGSFDFDPEARIEVYNLENRKIGEVDSSLSDAVGVVSIRGLIKSVYAGDLLFLVDRREQESINRRMRAVNRILERRAAIPELIDYLSNEDAPDPTEYESALSNEDLAAYNLNAGQRRAFERVLRIGPVGLLQGPPGTGKTRFIASLVHWLVTKGGARKILVASQSHEAVNNAIEAFIPLFRKQRQRLSLLRIGSKGIPERLRPYHTVELRERYRARFEGALKHRYMQLIAARGVAREFADAVYACDEEIGSLTRRWQLLAAAEDQHGITEKGVALQRVQRALQKAVKAYKIDEIVGASEAYDRAMGVVLSRYPQASPSDLKIALTSIGLARGWLAAIGGSDRNFDEFLAKTRAIVTATCVGVGQSRIRLEAASFDWVIVDEAARCTPSELAVPIQMGRRVLLVGDHLQLRPMFNSDVLSELSQEFQGLPEEQLSMSDFERSRYSRYGQGVALALDEQYRMDAAICGLVNDVFYRSHNVDLWTSKDRRPAIEWPDGDASWFRNAVTWINTDDDLIANTESKQPRGTSYYNDAEIEAIVRLLDALYDDAKLVAQLLAGDESIGVICMYAAQKHRLDLACARRPWKPEFRKIIRVDTVDAYQGKENAIVIVSLVRSNDHQGIGHVASPNRCNVAISRAKERLFIVGSWRMWTSIAADIPMKKVARAIAAGGGEIIKVAELP